MTESNTIIVLCNHCGNKTSHTLLASHSATFLYEQSGEERWYEPFEFYLYSCGTCQGVLLLGDFSCHLYPGMSRADYPRLYPVGASLLPPSYMMSPSHPVPQRVLQVYEEIWPLRHTAPNAFAGQIRRALEYICQEQNAEGDTLFRKLNDLTGKGILPATLAGMTTLIREGGNIGVHASEEDIDTWDAELIDALFRVVVEYVYIAPAKMKRLEERLKRRSSP